VTRAAKPSEADLEALENLARLSYLVQAKLTRVADAQDLTTVQARLLVVLSDREPPMLVLAGIMGLEKSSLTDLVDRAETRGLVERVTTPEDRRSVRVRLTAAGRRRCLASVDGAQFGSQRRTGSRPGGEGVVRKTGRRARPRATPRAVTRLEHGSTMDAVGCHAVAACMS